MTAAKKPTAKRKPRAKKTPQIGPELLDPWERQPGETDPAWQAWLNYRDQPLPRSMRRTARDLNKALTTIAEKAKRWQWVTRAQTWDVEQDRARTRGLLAKQEELGRRHAAMAAGHLTALAAPMQELMRRLSLAPEHPMHISMATLDAETLLRVQAAAARAFPRVAQAERLALGMNTEGPPAKDEAGDARRLSDAEIRRRLQGLDDEDPAPEIFLAGADAGRIAERERQAREQREAEAAREATLA